MASLSWTLMPHPQHRYPMIYITGSDGTGKTTQVRRLMDSLNAQGVPTVHRWLRFPFRLSRPLLAYARICGLSWYEIHPHGRQGYWDFRSSWVMRHLFPVMLLFDALSVAIHAVYWPLWRGKQVVCERFVADMLADMMVATQDFDLLTRWYVRWYRRLIPKSAIIILLDGEPPCIRERRKDLAYDRVLDHRIRAFRRIATHFDWPLIAGNQSIDAIHDIICTLVEDTYVTA